jgi:hypothetical protein
MRIRQTPKGIICSVIASIVISCVAVVAGEAPAAAPEPSKEMRAKMASVHEQMATCLRSDRPLVECRSEMMTGCQQLMGERGCHMMGMGMQNKMMKEPRSAVPKDK